MELDVYARLLLGMFDLSKPCAAYRRQQDDTGPRILPFEDRLLPTTHRCGVLFSTLVSSARFLIFHGINAALLKERCVRNATLRLVHLASTWISRIRRLPSRRAGGSAPRARELPLALDGSDPPACAASRRSRSAQGRRTVPLFARSTKTGIETTAGEYAAALAAAHTYGSESRLDRIFLGLCQPFPFAGMREAVTP